MKNFNIRQILFLLTGILFFFFLFYFGFKSLVQDNIKPERAGEEVNHLFEDGIFSRAGLKTDSSKALINLDEVLSGGPKKDGIPAIDSPKFISLNEANISDEDEGILVEGKDELKFYPYTILVWHEIVNDKIDRENIAVTFCPLCGTGIVYNREDKNFGVSGLLWQSNLLMYDRKTESLWSQAEGRAVVGEKAGESLGIFPSQLINFSDLKKIKTGKKKLVLSDNTGYTRGYGFFPYGDYDNSENLYFPVSDIDFEIHPKELLIVSRFGEKSFAFIREKILEEDSAELKINGKTFKAEKGDSGIIITDELGREYPSYVSMYFSWKNHNHDGVLQLD